MKNFLNIYLPTSFFTNLSLIFGIWYWHTSSLIPLFMAGGLIISTFIRKKIVSCFFISLFFIFGALSYSHKTRSLLPFNNLNNVFFEAKVMDKAFLENKTWRFKTLLFVEKYYYCNTWFAGNFLIYAYTQQKNYCWVDDTIICGPIDIKGIEENNFASYLQKEGIGGSIFCEELPYKKLERPAYSLRNWLFWQRELIQIKLFKKMSPKTFSLFSSLLMGNKNAVASKLDSYKNDFKSWGISHYLARSGLHLIIFVLIWNFLFNFLPLSFRFKHFLIFLLTLIYATFSWSSISFIRAIGAYFLYKIGTLLLYQTHPLHILSILCSALLIYNPLNLFALDFQLSFLLSFCLLWIAHLMHQKTIWVKSLAPTPE